MTLTSISELITSIVAFNWMNSINTKLKNKNFKFWWCDGTVSGVELYCGTKGGQDWFAPISLPNNFVKTKAIPKINTVWKIIIFHWIIRLYLMDLLITLKTDFILKFLSFETKYLLTCDPYSWQSSSINRKFFLLFEIKFKTFLGMPSIRTIYWNNWSIKK